MRFGLLILVLANGDVFVAPGPRGLYFLSALLSQIYHPFIAAFEVSEISTVYRLNFGMGADLSADLIPL
jgi:hypothetical protein